MQLIEHTTDLIDHHMCDVKFQSLFNDRTSKRLRSKLIVFNILNSYVSCRILQHTWKNKCIQTYNNNTTIIKMRLRNLTVVGNWTKNV